MDLNGPRDPIQEGLLVEGEEAWVARYEFLKSRGYLLRKRYRPGWAAHWKPTDSTLEIEEALVPWRRHLLDAQRISDGQVVVLKRVPRTDPEIEIGRYLSSDHLREDPRNHSVPLLDVLEDDEEPEHAILVLPLLRRIDEPPLESSDECIDLVDQTLEGLVFLHEHNIAHRDCNWPNLMMDAPKMFPRGFHPQSPDRYLDGTTFPISAGPSRTTAGGVKYYFIDFGISTRDQKMTLGLPGQVRAPELSDVVPYDPYKLDVYILGSAYQELLAEGDYDGGFLPKLVKLMTVAAPSDRPTAAEVQSEFLRLLQDAKAKSPDAVRIARPGFHLLRLIGDGLHTFWTFWWGVRI